MAIYLNPSPKQYCQYYMEFHDIAFGKDRENTEYSGGGLSGGLYPANPNISLQFYYLRISVSFPEG